LPFSLGTLEATGQSFPINETGRAASVALDGTLVYTDSPATGGTRTLVWRDRSGELIEAIGQPQPNMEDPALSPDGRRVAVSSSEMGNRDIWVHDLIRSTKTRLTFDEGAEGSPTWSPSGEEITYWIRGSKFSITNKAADGTGEAVALVEYELPMFRPDWSRDGRFLVYQQNNAETGHDIRYVELEADGGVSEPVTFLATSAAEQTPKLSPDGRFVAYASNESGRNEIYVRPFPDGAGRRQASVNGGGQVRWGSDGKELYYVEGEAALMAVSVSAEGALTLGQPQQLFETSDLRQPNAVTPTYDVSADGRRFVMIAPVVQGEEEAPAKIRIVQNWFEEFRDRQQ
jgi:Tol biopolymer transport system component